MDGNWSVTFINIWKTWQGILILKHSDARTHITLTQTFHIRYQRYHFNLDVIPAR